MRGHSSARETLDTCSDLFDDDLDRVAVALNATRAPLSVGEAWVKTAGAGPRGSSIPSRMKARSAIFTEPPVGFEPTTPALQERIGPLK